MSQAAYPVGMSTLEEIEVSLVESRIDVRLGLTDLPEGPGLYGIYGDDHAWSILGFGEPTNQGLLYLGLTLDGLNRRVIQTHFANRKTPWSILRRSLASLLQDELGLEATLAPSEAHRHFGLVRKSDGALSKWMRAHLQVGVWASDDPEELQVAEVQALAAWTPVLSPYAALPEHAERIELARQALSGSGLPVVVPSQEPAEQIPNQPVLPEPVQELLDGLVGGDPVLSLAQGKPTWLKDFDQDKIWLESIASQEKAVQGKGEKARSISTSGFVDAYNTLISTGTLSRPTLPSGVRRRSAFVLAALSRIDGVEVDLNPITLTIATN